MLSKSTDSLHFLEDWVYPRLLRGNWYSTESVGGQVEQEWHGISRGSQLLCGRGERQPSVRVQIICTQVNHIGVKADVLVSDRCHV
jgi:hypothetical protein